MLTKMGEKLSEKEFDEMVRVADSNGDGKIDYGGKKMFNMSAWLSNLIQYKDHAIFLKINSYYLVKSMRNDRIKAQYTAYTLVIKLDPSTSKAKRHNYKIKFVHEGNKCVY